MGFNLVTDLRFALDELQKNLDRWELRKNAAHDSGVSTLDPDSPNRAGKKDELPDSGNYQQ